MLRQLLVFFGRWMLLALVMLASGCALFAPDEPDRVMSSAQQKRLYAVNSWVLEGRVAVKSNEGSWSASLIWQHDQSIDKLRLAGPLGQGGVAVEMSEEAIQITHSDGTVVTSDAPEQLLQEEVGFHVPIAALRFWVLGLAVPEVDFKPRYDATNQLREIEQSGWRMSYERYVAVGEWILPEKLVIEQEDKRLKLVADEWVISD